jgi:deazaflavin-dependent oxidoreductase (nitroreductase family)
MSDQIFSLPLPRGFMAWLLRTPKWLYRFHLGGLLGNHVLLLTHIGRKTGQIRQTVIELVQHDEASGVFYVASGWGEKSDWYKNIMANPSVTIQVKNKKYKAVAERVTPEMGGQIVLNYVHRYPFAQRALSRIMKFPLDGSEESAINFGRNIPIIAFRTIRP